MNTKACNLTETEIGDLIKKYGDRLNNVLSNDGADFFIERMNYLHKRLKAFKDEKPAVAAPPATEAKDGW